MPLTRVSMRQDKDVGRHPRQVHCVLAADALTANLLGLAMGMAMIVGMVPALVATMRMLN